MLLIDAALPLNPQVISMRGVNSVLSPYKPQGATRLIQILTVDDFAHRDIIPVLVSLHEPVQGRETQPP